MKLKRLDENKRLNRPISEEVLDEDQWYDVYLADKSSPVTRPTGVQRKFAYLSDDPIVARDQADKIVANKKSGYISDFATKDLRSNIPDDSRVQRVVPSKVNPIKAGATANAIITDQTRGMRRDAHDEIDFGKKTGLLKFRKDDKEGVELDLSSVPDEYYIHHIDGDETNNTPQNLMIVDLGRYKQKLCGFIHWAFHLFGNRLSPNYSGSRVFDFITFDNSNKVVNKTLTVDIK